MTRLNVLLLVAPGDLRDAAVPPCRPLPSQLIDQLPQTRTRSPTPRVHS